MKVKPFAEHGHYTAVHDAVFDVVMPYCPPNAFKVLLFVLRKTRGWKKEADILRYAEIKKGTGIKSDATLSKELQWLIKKKLILAQTETGAEHQRGQRKAPAYSLNRDFELNLRTSENEADKGATTSENEVTSTSETEASNNHTNKNHTTTTKAREEKEELPVLLDDATGTALTILKRVKGFPRKQTENAIYLTELREEFPGVDAAEVCRQYEVWHRDNPGKSKRYRARLREFFKKAHADMSSGGGRVVPIRAGTAREEPHRRKKIHLG